MRGVWGPDAGKRRSGQTGPWAPWGRPEKIIVFSGRLVFWPLQGPLFLGSGMRRTIYYFHFLWIHVLKSFCAFNKKPYIAVGSRSYFLRSFCVLDRHYEPLFTFKNLCRLHLTSMLFCSVFCVFLFPISGIFALMFLS